MLTSACIAVYHRIDQLMILPLLGDEQLGLYSAAVRLAELPGIIPAALMVSVYPLLSRRFKEDREGSFVRTYNLAFKYLLALIVPVSWFVTVFSEQLVRGASSVGLLNGEYIPMHSTLAVLLWAEVFVFTGLVSFHILVAAGQQKLDLLIVLPAAVLNLVLNLILIPRWGIIGAAATTCISQLSGALVEYLIPATRSYVRGMIRNFKWPFLAGLVGLVPALIIAGTGGRLSSIALLWYGPLYALLYLGSMVASGWLTKEDWYLLRRALARGE